MPGSGDYQLVFGVTNWLDEAFDSGLAFDGATIGGQVIGAEAIVDGQVPEPATLLLLGSGLAVATARRRLTRR